MLGIENSLVIHAAEEGRHAALTVGQCWQSALEDIAEAGNPAEKRAAAVLLASVNGAIKTVLAGQASAIAAGAV